MVNNMNQQKLQHILYFIIALLSIVLINQISAFVFYRIDLTEEKRYTISKATMQMLAELEDEVYIEVYLDGDMPAGFKRLQKSLREMLDEFKIYGGRNIQFKFFDPQAEPNENLRKKFFMDLAKKGVQPTQVFDKVKGKKIEKVIFPGAILNYQEQQVPVMLLSGNRSDQPQEILNQSIENVEYQLASAIKGLVSFDKKSIAVLKGHDEMKGPELSEFISLMRSKYNVSSVDLTTAKNLDGFDAFVLIQPKIPFSETDKFKIDQFIMKGGKALFLIDEIRVNMDSMQEGATFAFNNNHKLADLFFRYGVRINSDLIQDLYSGAYPVVTGNMGDQANVQIMPWPFFPIINGFGDHAIVKNMDAVYLRFASSIDTVKASGLKKTPLLLTSQYSRKLPAPVRIDLNDMRENLVPEKIKDGPIITGVLLEGTFTSVFRNRFLPEGISDAQHVKESVSNKIIVISDADVARTDLNRQNGEPYQLGYDPYTRNSFANKEFLSNCLDYLLDDKGLIVSKNKEIKIRPLDKIKIEEAKLKWQIINILVPISLLILYGFVRNYYRKRKFENF